MAYIIGLYFVGLSRVDKPDFKQWAVFPSLSYIAGFSILYSLLSSPGLSISRYLSYNLGSLRLASGIFILFMSLYILFPDRISIFKKINGPFILAGLSLLLGLSFAVVYSPCITPTLSEILGLVNFPNMEIRGAVLALYYGSGLSLAFAITGLTFVSLLGKTRILVSNSVKTRTVCGLILGILAFLNITGFMTYYKAFVLGLLVEL